MGIDSSDLRLWRPGKDGTMTRGEARARLLAKLADPTSPAFDGAVALSCEVCGQHLSWVNPPPPPVPTVCVKHGRAGALIVEEPT